MYLTTPEFPELPRWTLAIGEFTTIPLPQGQWDCGMPDGLVRLVEAPWADDIKQTIAEIFRQAGIDEPFHQKLVDPSASAFGGRIDDDGNANLSTVNWHKVIDYFAWEAATSKKDRTHRDQLDQEAIEKYGHGFNHKSPYSSRGGY